MLKDQSSSSVLYAGFSRIWIQPLFCSQYAGHNFGNKGFSFTTSGARIQMRCNLCFLPKQKECAAQESVPSRRIRNMDLLVMEILKIKEGAIMKADEAFRLINSQLNNIYSILKKSARLANGNRSVCGICKTKIKNLRVFEKPKIYSMHIF
jgi:hypothetical protein